MENLSPDLINEVLLLLPVKSLLRFRSICKSFYSLIDSHDFIYSHLHTCSKKRLHRKLICHKNYKNRTYIHALDIDNDSFEEVPLDFELQFRYSFFVASCNGLHLLITSDTIISVLNPSTRNYRELPAFPVNSPQTIYFGYQYLGFGYDSTTDDYKVLRIICTKFCYQVWILELRSSRWRRIQNFPYIKYTNFQRANFRNCFLDGYVYILCYENGKGSHIIMAFDVAKETFSVVPEPIYQTQGKRILLDVFEGCLSFTVQTPSVVDLYLRKKEGVVFTWTKLFSLSKLFCPKFLGYSKEGDNVLVSCLGYLYSYDLIERSLERIKTSLIEKLCERDLFDFRVLYGESLVSINSLKR
ncbi:F-box protein CPR1-like [Euphorbia lathyris]|uniref:F-box protein CPR1-like n=1 Tax=Euphorbia lathyris TaxID=212925 RepID=UPI003313A571